MARLPFDPDKLAGPDPAKAEQPARRERSRYAALPVDRPLSVSEVCDLIKRVLADRTPSPLRIVGEISNFSDRTHWFFSLKDEQNVLSCVMWASAADRCGFTPEHGQQVVATGRLDYYGPQGRLQLYVERLEPVGRGALELRFRQLCDELRRLGYFGEDRKRPMPRFPVHIAVVTSRKGAALQDVVNTARQRWAGIRLSLLDVRVQGEGAATEIAAAIDALGQAHERLGVEAVILTRGGGSLEDLWAFNERAVADAIYRSEVPIAAAIGHETDTTIAELVADLRCSTPTQAAARLAPDAEAERHRLAQLTGRLTTSLRRRNEQARAAVEALSRHPVFRRPVEPLMRKRENLKHLEHRLRAASLQIIGLLQRRLAEAHHRLGRLEPAGRSRLARHQVDALADRLRAGMGRRIDQRRDRLIALERELRAIGPRNVLSRGYSYTTMRDGQIVRSVHRVQPGERIVTHVIDGRIESEVLGEKPTRRRSGRSGGGRKRGGAGRDPSPGLFDTDEG